MITFSSISHMFDVLLPPRASERAVRAITIDTLRNLALPGQPLPYRDDGIRALVWEIKYRRGAYALSLAGQFLAEAALAIGEEALSQPVLVPVPMHESRKKARGYNQTELLCEAMMKASPHSFAYAPNALARTRNTIPQQGLPRYRRLKNILGAIEVADAQPVKGKLCIIIDDVSTTGATAHETKRALFAAGASEAHILTLAHS